MKRSFVASAALSLTLVGSPAAAQEAPAVPESLAARASYSIGFNLGRNLAAQGVEIDHDMIARGVADGGSGAEPLMTVEQMDAAVGELQKQVAELQAERARVLGEKNREAATAFLASNGAREDVVTTESGLQYRVLTEGTGPKPSAQDRVRVHYTGTLLDGTKFDSSVDRGEPVAFKLDGVIAGWQEALPLMKVGSKWKLFVPSGLAYGERGAPPVIGPHALLIFEVELLAIEEAG